MFTAYILTLALLSCIVVIEALLPSIPRHATTTRMAPLKESLLGLGENPIDNTDPLLLGEVNYKNFVGSYKEDALLLGNENYNPIDRIRAMQLLSITADSGLLEALEEKGVTLSAVEKLLPIVDDLGLLPLVKNNKQTILNLAPLLLEPAPLLLPIVASVVKTPASTFQLLGAGLLGAGALEFGQTAPLGVILILLGLPLTALGSVLGQLGSLGSLPSASTYSTAKGVAPTASSGRARKTTKASRSKAPTVKVAPGGGSMNGKRKLIKIK